MCGILGVIGSEPDGLARGWTAAWVRSLTAAPMRMT